MQSLYFGQCYELVVVGGELEVDLLQCVIYYEFGFGEYLQVGYCGCDGGCEFGGCGCVQVVEGWFVDGDCMKFMFVGCLGCDCDDFFDWWGGMIVQ